MAYDPLQNSWFEFWIAHLNFQLQHLNFTAEFINGQNKIFKLFRSRRHFGVNYRTLTFTFQQSKQQGTRSIGRHLPPPQRLLLSWPMITEALTKIRKLSWKYTMLSLKFDAVTGETAVVIWQSKVKWKIWVQKLNGKCKNVFQWCEL